MELAEVLAAGKFTATVTQYAAAVGGGEPTAAKTLIAFNEGDVAVGDEIRVSYRRRIVDANVLTITEKTTSTRGELAIHWPISSDGLGDGASSRKGVLHVVIPRVMVSALPGFDNSYKSASTNSVSFQAMNPRRADQKIYDIYYELLNDSGGFRTEATSGTVSYT